jgi:hypothetical protein
MNRRPSLYRDQLDPRGPGFTPGTPRPGGDHGGRGRRGGYYYDPYYDPFYGSYYGFGYGLFPYGGPFDAYDYYSNRSVYGPYDRDVRGDSRDESRRGNIELRIEPRDVDVYVDGVLETRDGRAVLNLPTGRYRLEFVRPGYRPEAVDLEVTQGVSYRVQRRLERLRGEAAEEPRDLADRGELRLDVKPHDAIVYLDGRAMGFAGDLRDSMALRRLAPGRHTLEARKPGYATLRREVVISPVQAAEVRGTLVPE